VARLLLDTSAIYASIVRQDRNHEAAASLFHEQVRSGRGFVILDLVFAECLTLIRARWGAQAAVRVGKRLREPTVFQWQSLSPLLEQRTWHMFERYLDKDWSYTDCAVLALAQQLGTPEVFTFDRHFRQMPGIIPVPGLQ